MSSSTTSGQQQTATSVTSSSTTDRISDPRYQWFEKTTSSYFRCRASDIQRALDRDEVRRDLLQFFDTALFSNMFVLHDSTISPPTVTVTLGTAPMKDVITTAPSKNNTSNQQQNQQSGGGGAVSSMGASTMFGASSAMPLSSMMNKSTTMKMSQSTMMVASPGSGSENASSASPIVGNVLSSNQTVHVTNRKRYLLFSRLGKERLVPETLSTRVNIVELSADLLGSASWMLRSVVFPLLKATPVHGQNLDYNNNRGAAISSGSMISNDNFDQEASFSSFEFGSSIGVGGTSLLSEQQQHPQLIASGCSRTVGKTLVASDAALAALTNSVRHIANALVPLCSTISGSVVLSHTILQHRAPQLFNSDEIEARDCLIGPDFAHVHELETVTKTWIEQLQQATSVDVPNFDIDDLYGPEGFFAGQDPLAGTTTNVGASATGDSTSENQHQSSSATTQDNNTIGEGTTERHSSSTNTKSSSSSLLYSSQSDIVCPIRRPLNEVIRRRHRLHVLLQVQHETSSPIVMSARQSLIARQSPLSAPLEEAIQNLQTHVAACQDDLKYLEPLISLFKELDVPTSYHQTLIPELQQQQNQNQHHNQSARGFHNSTMMRKSMKMMSSSTVIGDASSSNINQSTSTSSSGVINAKFIETLAEGLPQKKCFVGLGVFFARNDHMANAEVIGGLVRGVVEGILQKILAYCNVEFLFNDNSQDLEQRISLALSALRSTKNAYAYLVEVAFKYRPGNNENNNSQEESPSISSPSGKKKSSKSKYSTPKLWKIPAPLIFDRLDRLVERLLEVSKLCKKKSASSAEMLSALPGPAETFRKAVLASEDRRVGAIQEFSTEGLAQLGFLSTRSFDRLLVSLNDALTASDVAVADAALKFAKSAPLDTDTLDTLAMMSHVFSSPNLHQMWFKVLDVVFKQWLCFARYLEEVFKSTRTAVIRIISCADVLPSSRNQNNNNQFQYQNSQEDYHQQFQRRNTAAAVSSDEQQTTDEQEQEQQPQTSTYVPALLIYEVIKRISTALTHAAKLHDKILNLIRSTPIDVETVLNIDIEENEDDDNNNNNEDEYQNNKNNTDIIERLKNEPRFAGSIKSLVNLKNQIIDLYQLGAAEDDESKMMCQDSLTSFLSKCEHYLLLLQEDHNCWTAISRNIKVCSQLAKSFRDVVRIAFKYSIIQAKELRDFYVVVRLSFPITNNNQHQSRGSLSGSGSMMYTTGTNSPANLSAQQSSVQVPPLAQPNPNASATLRGSTASDILNMGATSDNNNNIMLFHHSWLPGIGDEQVNCARFIAPLYRLIHSTNGHLQQLFLPPVMIPPSISTALNEIANTQTRLATLRGLLSRHVQLSDSLDEASRSLLKIELEIVNELLLETGTKLTWKKTKEIEMFFARLSVSLETVSSVTTFLLHSPAALEETFRRLATVGRFQIFPLPVQEPRLISAEDAATADILGVVHTTPPFFLEIAQFRELCDDSIACTRGALLECARRFTQLISDRSLDALNEIKVTNGLPPIPGSSPAWSAALERAARRVQTSYERFASQCIRSMTNQLTVGCLGGRQHLFDLLVQNIDSEGATLRRRLANWMTSAWDAVTTGGTSDRQWMKTCKNILRALNEYFEKGFDKIIEVDGIRYLDSGEDEEDYYDTTNPDHNTNNRMGVVNDAAFGEVVVEDHDGMMMMHSSQPDLLSIADEDDENDSQNSANNENAAEENKNKLSLLINPSLGIEISAVFLRSVILYNYGFAKHFSYVTRDIDDEFDADLNDDDDDEDENGDDNNNSPQQRAEALFFSDAFEDDDDDNNNNQFGDDNDDDDTTEDDDNDSDEGSALFAIKKARAGSRKKGQSFAIRCRRNRTISLEAQELHVQLEEAQENVDQVLEALLGPMHRLWSCLDAEQVLNEEIEGDLETAAVLTNESYENIVVSNTNSNTNQQQQQNTTNTDSQPQHQSSAAEKKHQITECKLEVECLGTTFNAIHNKLQLYQRASQSIIEDVPDLVLVRDWFRLDFRRIRSRMKELASGVEACLCEHTFKQMSESLRGIEDLIRELDRNILENKEKALEVENEEELEELQQKEQKEQKEQEEQNTCSSTLVKCRQNDALLTIVESLRQIELHRLSVPKKFPILSSVINLLLHHATGSLRGECLQTEVRLADLPQDWDNAIRRALSTRDALSGRIQTEQVRLKNEADQVNEEVTKWQEEHFLKKSPAVAGLSFSECYRDEQSSNGTCEIIPSVFETVYEELEVSYQRLCRHYDHLLEIRALQKIYDAVPASLEIVQSAKNDVVEAKHLWDFISHTVTEISSFFILRLRADKTGSLADKVRFLRESLFSKRPKHLRDWPIFRQVDERLRFLYASFPSVNDIAVANLKNRHWEDLRRSCNRNLVFVSEKETESMKNNKYWCPQKVKTVGELVSFHLTSHSSDLGRILEQAEKESQIEKSLDEICTYWDTTTVPVLMPPFSLNTVRMRSEALSILLARGSSSNATSSDDNQQQQQDSGEAEAVSSPASPSAGSMINFDCALLIGADEMIEIAQEHISRLQSMISSRWASVFITTLEKYQSLISEAETSLFAWADVQRQWLSLRPIYAKGSDLLQQLPQHAEHFKTAEVEFIDQIKVLNNETKVLDVCSLKFEMLLMKLSKEFQHCEHGLARFLASKRQRFSRFYFLSDSDLIDLLASAHDPKRACCTHIGRIIEAVQTVSGMTKHVDVSLTASATTGSFGGSASALSIPAFGGSGTVGGSHRSPRTATNVTPPVALIEKKSSQSSGSRRQNKRMTSFGSVQNNNNPPSSSSPLSTRHYRGPFDEDSMTDEEDEDSESHHHHHQMYTEDGETPTASNLTSRAVSKSPSSANVLSSLSRSPSTASHHPPIQRELSSSSSSSLHKHRSGTKTMTTKKLFSVRTLKSRENEQLHLVSPVTLEHSVDVWLDALLMESQRSVLWSTLRACSTFSEQRRTSWMFSNVTQATTVAMRTIWTRDVTAALDSVDRGNASAVADTSRQHQSGLTELIEIVSDSSLTTLKRKAVITWITVSVHQRDVLAELQESLEGADAGSNTQYIWQRQLRFYLQPSQYSHQTQHQQHHHQTNKHQRGTFRQRSNVSRTASSISPSSPFLQHQQEKPSPQNSYLLDSDIICNISDASFKYGGEYHGACGCLVFTPLTSRCYLTLAQALKLHMGGAPAGPAGTGKTETVKDMARAIGLPCYVVNCSNQMSHHTLANIFQGLAASGSWGCFDEFNRISVEVLSVVATQVRTVFEAVRSRAPVFSLGAEVGDDGKPVFLPLRREVGIFITMNPGYKGRTELPQNVKALFRPVAMIVPDVQQICEILLSAEGFVTAKSLAVKFARCYTYAKQQLSSQMQYDWGLRAMRAVLLVAGNGKRAALEVMEKYNNSASSSTMMRMEDSNNHNNSQNKESRFSSTQRRPSFSSSSMLMSGSFAGGAISLSQEQESLIFARALYTSNLAKMHLSDVALLKRLILSLFPDVTAESLVQMGDQDGDTEELIEAVKSEAALRLISLGDDNNSSFLRKCSQLIDALKVRHSIFVMGAPLSGKTTLWRLLSCAYNAVGLKPWIEVIEPKTLTSDELYGFVHPQSHEWNDGILSKTFRNFAQLSHASSSANATSSNSKTSQQQQNDDDVNFSKLSKKMSSVSGKEKQQPSHSKSHHVTFFDDDEGEYDDDDNTLSSNTTSKKPSFREPTAASSSASNQQQNQHLQLLQKIPKWIVLDGMIDPNWCENLNSVMDENKLLTLPNNERISMTGSMRLMFEFSNISQATPATVSRAGIIVMNEGDVGWSAVKDRFIGLIADPTHRSLLDALMEKHMGTALAFAHEALPRDTFEWFQQATSSSSSSSAHQAASSSGSSSSSGGGDSNIFIPSSKSIEWTRAICSLFQGIIQQDEFRNCHPLPIEIVEPLFLWCVGNVLGSSIPQVSQFGHLGTNYDQRYNFSQAFRRQFPALKYPVTEIGGGGILGGGGGSGGSAPLAQIPATIFDVRPVITRMDNAPEGSQPVGTITLPWTPPTSRAAMNVQNAASTNKHKQPQPQPPASSSNPASASMRMKRSIMGASGINNKSMNPPPSSSSVSSTPQSTTTPSSSHQKSEFLSFKFVRWDSAYFSSLQVHQANEFSTAAASGGDLSSNKQQQDTMMSGADGKTNNTTGNHQNTQSNIPLPYYNPLHPCRFQLHPSTPWMYQLVPTADAIRINFFSDVLLSQPDVNVLLVGPTSSAKTLLARSFWLRNSGKMRTRYVDTENFGAHREDLLAKASRVVPDYRQYGNKSTSDQQDNSNNNNLTSSQSQSQSQSSSSTTIDSCFKTAITQTHWFSSWSYTSDRSQAQQQVESLLERRGPHSLGPAGGLNNNLVLVVDDLNLPEVDEFSCSSALSFLRQLISLKSLYDKERLVSKDVQDLRVLATLDPTREGCGALDDRLLARFIPFSLAAAHEENAKFVLNTLMTAHCSAARMKHDLINDIPRVSSLLVDVLVYLGGSFSPSEAFPQHRFTMRDMTRAAETLCRALRPKTSSSTSLPAATIYHTTRAVADRLGTSGYMHHLTQFIRESVLNRFADNSGAADLLELGENPVFIPPCGKKSSSSNDQQQQQQANNNQNDDVDEDEEDPDNSKKPLLGCNTPTLCVAIEQVSNIANLNTSSKYSFGNYQTQELLHNKAILMDTGTVTGIVTIDTSSNNNNTSANTMKTSSSSTSDHSIITTSGTSNSAINRLASSYSDWASCDYFRLDSLHLLQRFIEEGIVRGKTTTSSSTAVQHAEDTKSVVSSSHPGDNTDHSENESSSSPQQHDPHTQAVNDHPLLSNFVFFDAALQLIASCARILASPGGHILLLGLGGSGRRYVLRLAAMYLGYELVTADVSSISEDFKDLQEWRSQISQWQMKAVLKDVKLCIAVTGCENTTHGGNLILSQLHEILRNGICFSSFTSEEKEEIVSAIQSSKQTLPSAMQAPFVDSNVVPTPYDGESQIWDSFVVRSRQNIHVAVVMSLIPTQIRKLRRRFPAFTDETQLLHSHPWSKTALFNVCQDIFKKSGVMVDEEMEKSSSLHLSQNRFDTSITSTSSTAMMKPTTDEENLHDEKTSLSSSKPPTPKSNNRTSSSALPPHIANDICDLLSQAHNLVVRLASSNTSSSSASSDESSSSSTKILVTPKHFLQCANMFIKLLKRKNADVSSQIRRLTEGLLRIDECEEQVEQLKLRLTVEGEAVKTKAQETSELLMVVEEEKAIVSEQHQLAELEEGRVKKLVDDVATLVEDCNHELQMALPAVHAAKAALNTLTKQNLTELKAMGKPPADVHGVTACVMCLTTPPGERIPKDRTWQTAKNKMMTDVGKWLRELQEYDVNNIPEQNVAAVRSTIADPTFNRAVIEKKSYAAAGLCEWVINIVKYHDLHQLFIPKERRLAEARQHELESKEKLEKVRTKLADYKKKLDAVVERYEKAKNEQQRLQDTMKKTEAQLDRARRLVSSLGGERKRWLASREQLELNAKRVAPDLALASVFFVYAGAFNFSQRKKLWDTLVSLACSINGYSLMSRIPLFKNPDQIPSDAPVSTLFNEADLAEWSACGLPTDTFSRQSAAIVNANEGPLSPTVLIDPQHRAHNWISETVRSKSSQNVHSTTLTILQPDSSAKLASGLMSAIHTGKSVLVAGVSSISRALLAVMEGLAAARTSSLSANVDFDDDNKTKTKKMVKKDIVISVPGYNEVTLDPNFRLYIQFLDSSSSSSSRQNQQQVSAECFTLANVVDFSATEDGFVEQLLDRALQLDRPELQIELSQLRSMMNQITVSLRQREDALLEQLSTAGTSILDDESLVSSLERTRSEARSMHQTLDASEEKKKLTTEATRMYLPVALRATTVFLRLQAMRSVDPIYLFSIDPVLEEFDRGIFLAQEELDVLNPETNLLKDDEEDDDQDDQDVVVPESKPARPIENEGEFGAMLKSTTSPDDVIAVDDDDDERKEVIPGLEDEKKNTTTVSSSTFETEYTSRPSFRTFSNLNRQQSLTIIKKRQNMLKTAPLMKIQNRVNIMMQKVTECIFTHGARAIFSQHKLAFASSVCFSILLQNHYPHLTMNHIDTLLKFPRRLDCTTVPGAAQWLSLTQWQSLDGLSRVRIVSQQQQQPVIANSSNDGNNLKKSSSPTTSSSTTKQPFSGLLDDIVSNARWRTWVAHPTPESEKPPGAFRNVSDVEHLLLVRCLRSDRFATALRHFVAEHLGSFAVSDEQQLDMTGILKRHRAVTPVLFVVSAGADAASIVNDLATRAGYSERNGTVTHISLGQGQEEKALHSLQRAYRDRSWVVLHNVHLLPSWSFKLERELARLEQESKLLPEDEGAKLYRGEEQERRMFEEIEKERQAALLKQEEERLRREQLGRSEHLGLSLHTFGDQSTTMMASMMQQSTTANAFLASSTSMSFDPQNRNSTMNDSQQPFAHPLAYTHRFAGGPQTLTVLCEADVKLLALTENIANDGQLALPGKTTTSANTTTSKNAGKSATNFNRSVQASSFRPSSANNNNATTTTSDEDQQQQQAASAINFATFLQKTLEDVADPDLRSFRVFLTAEPRDQPLLGNLVTRCIKIVCEPPQGVASNFIRAYSIFDDEPWEGSPRPNEMHGIVFSLCFFHALVIERIKFGPIGWNKKYPFSVEDLKCAVQIAMSASDGSGLNQGGGSGSGASGASGAAGGGQQSGASSRIQWAHLRFFISRIIYGGHIVDPFDLRLCSTYLDLLLSPELLESGEIVNGVPMPGRRTHEDMIALLSESFPSESEEDPSIFHMHAASANRKGTVESQRLVSVLGVVAATSSLAPATSSSTSSTLSSTGDSSSLSPQQQQHHSPSPNDDNNTANSTIPADDTIALLIGSVPEALPVNVVHERFDMEGVDNVSPLQLLMLRESERMNRLTALIRGTLESLDLAERGGRFMTEHDHDILVALKRDTIPEAWLAQWGPTARPLAAWLVLINESYSYLLNWCNEINIPKIICVRYLFSPSALFSALQQDAATKLGVSLETVDLTLDVLKTKQQQQNIQNNNQQQQFSAGGSQQSMMSAMRAAEIASARVREGAVIVGLTLDGAAWDSNANSLAEAPSSILESLNLGLMPPLAVRGAATASSSSSSGDTTSNTRHNNSRDGAEGKNQSSSSTGNANNNSSSSSSSSASAIPPDRPNTYFCPLYRTWKRGESWVITLPLRTKEPQSKWVLRSVALIADDHGSQ